MTTPLELDFAALGSLRQIGSGGQGRVFALPESDNESRYVYKEYSPRVVDDLDVDALRRFVRFGRELSGPDRGALLSRLAWPEAIVRRDGVVRGFVMRRAPEAYTAEMRFGAEKSRELALVQYLLNPPSYLADRGLKVDERFRLEFLRDTADTLALLHRLGISVGDLSPNNLLFSLTARPRSFFIDCDAMRLGSDMVLAPTETPDWQVSGDEEPGTEAGDAYKFGLLVTRLFASDQQTRDPASVPVRLRRHAVASLAPEPGVRTDFPVWIRVLDRQLRRNGRVRTRAVRTVSEARSDPEPRSEPEARPRSRVRIGLWAVPVAAGALLTVLLSNSGNHYATLPSNVGPAFTEPGGTQLNLPQPTWGIGGLPTMPRLSIPSLNLDISCLLPARTAPEVRGGAGLHDAANSLGELVCSVNTGDRGTAVSGPGWGQLFDHAPYDGATITGFWGEGTASPRATVKFGASGDAQCWTGSVGFDSAYAVDSVGPLSASACG